MGLSHCTAPAYLKEVTIMKLNLEKNFFTETKKELLTHGKFTITAFRYTSGVEALEVTNEKCSFIFTPFKLSLFIPFK